MPQLRLASFGYLLYAIRDDGRCQVMGAPLVPALPHKCELLIRAPIPAAPGLDISQGPGGGSIVHLRRCNVAFSEAAPGRSGAERREFRWIADFASLCCGVSLAPDWREAKALDVRVDFADGLLIAVPDAHTNKAEWSWDDCAGARVRMRLTSLTIYEVELPTPRIIIRPRSAGGSAGEIPLPNGDVILAFRSVPITDPGEGREHVVDLAHASSTMDLCRFTGAPRLMLGEQHVLPDNLPRPQLPADVEEFLDLAGERFRGRPNCGSRQMAEA